MDKKILNEDYRQITIGYGGYAKITGGNNTNLHITNGNFSLQFNRPIQNCVFAPVPQPQKTLSVSPIILSVGTAVINGSVSFDLSKDNITKLISPSFLRRGNNFTIQLFDGRIGYRIFDCSWNSVSINASPGGLVQGAINFIALNNHETSIQKITDDIKDVNYVFKDQLVAYWQAGATDIQSFSLNFSLDVIPIYLNNQYIMPTYFRYGNIGIKLDINSFLDWKGIKGKEGVFDENTFTLKIAEKSIKINNKVTEIQQFTQNGAGDVGMHNYSIFGYLPSSSPYDELFTIE